MLSRQRHSVKRTRVGFWGWNSITPDVRNVGLTIAIQSPGDEEAVRRVYQAWQERCPIYLALTKALPVATSLDIKRAYVAGQSRRKT
jgi:uncharacterized OsmC-like protein